MSDCPRILLQALILFDDGAVAATCLYIKRICTITIRHYGGGFKLVSRSNRCGYLDIQVTSSGKLTFPSANAQGVPAINEVYIFDELVSIIDSGGWMDEVYAAIVYCMEGWGGEREYQNGRD
ncbi:hypothetical protein P691DRAFT_789813 [Macrolepiota fuliginosa MF-IS2]|uniref:Uncharacterized protein n=1 Tax=Macrolepiota fuliginosa MF-IS2 TaxID=1400762 RepID=A0A9P6BY30_9AGAR|nr:hypothetical protein P691DRAFT_789813 [Macrolepiota fuliginosa MF-IS2]